MRWRRQVLLAMLFAFEREGRNEISLTEILEGIHELGRVVKLGYSFAQRVFYSRRLLRDLEALSGRGYLNSYRYIHDSFVPKSFVRLTSLGRGEGRASFEKLDLELRQIITEKTRTAMRRFDERWKLFARAAASK